MIGRRLADLSGRDHDGDVPFRVIATPAGLAIAVADRTVLLDRQAVQTARHALTDWLVDAAPASTP